MTADETKISRIRDVGAPPPEDLVGTVLAGRYRIQRLLGIGAMGAVYLGQHVKIGRKDAIKVLHPDMARDPDAIARFDRGARNVGAIRHPNVCTIYDFSNTDDGLQYLAMEFVAGEALSDILDRDGPLDLPRAVAIAEQIASALQAAHDVGVVHRDLKPANIMVATNPDGSDAVKVVDFDISKGSEEDAKGSVTQHGLIVGTPEYMSPEQVCGDKLDGRSDVYSLALVAYRMIAGALPFRAESMQEMLTARLSDTGYLRLDQIRPGNTFPSGIEDALARALRQRASERTPTASQFAAELHAAAHPSPRMSLADRFAETRITPALEEVPATAASPVGAAVPATVEGGAAVRTRKMPRVRVLGIAAGIVIVIAASSAVLLKPTAAPAPASTIPVTDDNAAVPNVAAQTATTPSNPDASLARRSATNTPATSARRPQLVPSALPGAPTGRAEQQPVAADKTQRFTLEQVKPILDAQRERMFDAPLPAPSALRAMRDTAVSLYGLDGVGIGERARAAFMAASISEHLADRDVCVTWLTRARALAPTSQGYASFSCGS